MIRSTVILSLLLVVGCRDNGVKDDKPPVKVDQPPTDTQDVWLRIDGMSERLKII
jgi:hypothetical protein